MKGLTHLVLACLVSLVVLDTARAVPDLRTPRIAGPLTVFSDDQRADLFYYPPGELVLSTASDGKPDLHFLQIRYTGNVSSGDRGTSIYRSLLSFRIVMAGPTSAQVQAAKTALIASGARRNLELRPLPICRMEASLVYAPITAAVPTATASPSPAETSPGAPESSVQTLPPGHFEEAEGVGSQLRGGYWSQRIYTLSLEPAAAQIFWDTLQRGQVALSIAYAFYSNGIGPENPIEELSGSPELVAELRRQIAVRRSVDSTGERPRQPEYLVRAGATAITLEAQRWTDLFRRIDVNQQNAPPGYALIDVYCYDFNNSLRPDLHEKQVELVAEGIAGRPVKQLVYFKRSQPELYSRSLRFPVAVRMDRPLSYRVREVGADGTEKVSAWQERASWIDLIDVTTQSPASNPGATNPGD